MKELLYLEIGKRIRELRGKENQTDYANSLGIKQGTLSKYESGEEKISLKTLFEIVKIGNKSFDWLLTGEEKEKEKEGKKGDLDEIDKEILGLVHGLKSERDRLKILDLLEEEVEIMEMIAERRRSKGAKKKRRN